LRPPKVAEEKYLIGRYTYGYEEATKITTAAVSCGEVWQKTSLIQLRMIGFLNHYPMHFSTLE
jgi:hypothetical protein